LTGFKLNEIFINGVIGTQTGSDRTLSAPSEKELKQLLKDLYSVEISSEFIKEYQYRPFETRFMFFLKSLNDNIYPSVKIPASYRSRYNTSKHLLNKNVALLIPRQIAENNYYHSFICKNIADACLISNKTKEQNQVFPLYLYPETNGQQTIGQTAARTPNLNAAIVQQLANGLGLTFTHEKETTTDTFAPIDLLDYIYAVLHSPTYREKYKEFLKIDFPRVPYPTTLSKFRTLTKLGGELRQLHLLESPTVEKYITQYPIDGGNVVGKPKYIPISKNETTGLLQGNVYINETQYFANVPLIAWSFYIGGYQPAQKWLKDRKDRTLEFDDILHYQKIIVALTETDRLMQEIDGVGLE
jgi:predicted helicase